MENASMQTASDVAENFVRFLVRSVHVRGMTEFIPTVKIETRYPVVGSFASEIPAISDHPILVFCPWS